VEDDDFEGPRSERGMTFPAAVLWSFGLVFSWILLGAMTEGARPGASIDLVNLTACRVVAVSVFLFAMLRVYTPKGSIRDVLGVRPVSPVATGLAIAVGALLAPGLSIVDDVITAHFPLPAEDAELLDRLMNMTSRGERVVLFAAFVIVIPLCDELFFRGVIFRGLRRGRAEGAAILGSALLYALSRGMDLRSLPTGLVVGLLAAWLRGRSGSIVPAVLANVARNALPLVPFVLGKPDVPVGGRVAIGGVIAAALCAWGAAMIFARDDRAEEGRLLDA
jgi:membrane protease YdiL (CAAX protease family)